MSIDDQVMDEITDLISRGQKLEAVKVYKYHTHTSLAEAKTAIEALESQMAQSRDSEPIEADIEQLIYSGQKLEAIKVHKERHGLSLLDAKTAIEQMTAELKRKHPERFDAPKASGCMSILFAVALLATASWVIVRCS